MQLSEIRRVVKLQGLSEEGAMWKLRENEFDELGFSQVIDAINKYAVLINGSMELDRELIAVLFEMPWEMENTIPHYKETVGSEVAEKISKQADDLRMAIHEFLWGFEKIERN